MNTAGTWYYPPCAGTGNLLLANPPFIFDLMNTNQPTTTEGLYELTEEQFQQISDGYFGGSRSKNQWAVCDYAHALRIAQRAYWLGADQELEAYTRMLRRVGINELSIKAICAARRPKPPTIKEQALAILDDCNLDAAHENALRRALEALPDA